jgi:photosystem II stability/assembly factor-like uncharacterized protein
MATKLLYAKTICLIALFIILNKTVHAQWQKTAGPAGMNVNTFYQRGDVLFAGTTPRGVFKSSDHGVTWVAANNGITERNVFSLTANSQFLFAGTDSGVFRSPDNGVTWQRANFGIESKFVYSFLFANGFLFAGTSGGLYKSSNNGASWTDANGSALNSSIIHDITFSAPHLIASADNLIFYSDDNGNSWNYNSRSPFILGNNPSFFTNGDSIIITSGPVIFRSFDGGINWGRSINVSTDATIDGIVTAGKYIVAGTPSGLFYSPNFGASWQSIAAHGIRHGKYFDHKFYRSGSNFLLAYDEIGIGYSSDSGRNWNYTLQGFPPAASIDDALTFSNNTLLSGTHGDGVYKSTNAGNTWTKIGTSNNLDTLSNSNIFSILRTNNVILAGTCGNGLYRSADNGVTWSHITAGLPNQQGTGFLCVHALAKTNTAILTGTDQGLFYSNDVGLTWNATSLNGKDVVGVAANDSVACAAIENFIGPSEIYRSVNNPSLWNVVLQASGEDWTTMASDGKSHFYAGTLMTSNWVSNNNGVTWQTVGTGIPPGSGAYAIGVLNNNVFIGNNNGVYFSNNNAKSFSEVNTGFDDIHAVQGFAISSTDIYAGLFENSVWKRPLSDFGITALQQHEVNILPVTFAPNPLINQSKLTYSIASTQHVVINLYSANGNFIKNIKDEIQNAGAYSLTINKDGLHVGNYFISVLTGNQHAMVNVVVEGN